MSAASTPKRPNEEPIHYDAPADKRARREPSLRHGHSQLLPDNYSSEGTSAPIEHQPGAIRRVKLKNFVTYSSVEFLPGPSLNMVIGPNGTGKSTLVCAICIGLGYDPKFLGRAKELSEFVKHGQNEAHIELELQRPPNRAKHPVFRCTIKRDGNKAVYSIDDKPFGSRQIKSRAAKLGVQIDNLCQFLPQDRVVEFAGMTPVELLNQTQRAIASQEMLDWHEQLKSTRKDQRNLEGKKADMTEALDSLEAKHRMQEADVQRIRDRDEVRDTVELLETLKPFSEYREAKQIAVEKREDFKRLCEELEELEASVEPHVKELKAKQTYKTGVEAAIAQRTADVEQKVAQVGQVDKEIEQLDKKVQGNENKRRSEKSSVRAAEIDAQRVSNTLRGLKAQADQPPPASQEEIDAKTENIRRCEREKREISDSQKEDRATFMHLQDDKSTRERRIQEKEAEITSLQSKSGQQVQKLRNVNPEAYRAYEWLRKNPDRFEKQVFGPPLVECSVKDKRFADIVETALGINELQVFTVQTSNDFRLLQRSLRELGLSRVNQRTISVGLGSYRGNDAVLREHGLDGWILDMIDGPEAVLATLCEGAKVHQTGYCLRELHEEQFESLKQSSLGRVMTAKTSYQYQRRREYGPGATNVVSRDINKARFFTDAPVDTSAIQTLQANINELRDEISQLSASMAEIRSDRQQRLKTRNEQLDNEIKSLTDEKKDMQRALTAYNALPTRIETARQGIQGYQKTINEYRDRDRQLVREGDDLAVQKVQSSLKYASAVDELSIAHRSLQDCQIVQIEAISDLEVLTTRNADVTAQVAAKKDDRTNVGNTMKEAQAKAKEIAESVKHALSGKGQDFKDKIRDAQTRFESLAALNAEIESAKARLELMEGDNNGSTLAQYEKRAKHIASMKSQLEALDASLSEMSGIISEIRQKWEPQLDDLIKLVSHSFSYNMRQISCAGEVGIHKDEDDFDQWAIKVMVKFREHEDLSQLDAHRQSGGERAVSTVFYLMSLQTLARSPFRVVDEINQGMDPRNERLVHARMVAIATGTDDMPPPVLQLPSRRRNNDEDEDGEEGDDTDEEHQREEEEAARAELTRLTRHKGSQYFLITPKLLPDLKYERGMRVLCIASGEHMPPAESNAVDFRQQLALRRNVVATAAG